MFFMLIDLESIIPDGETTLESQTKKRGRPKTRRIRSQGEEDAENQKTCSKCKRKGHYSTTCATEIEERSIVVASQVIPQISGGNALQQANVGTKKTRKQYTCKNCGLPGHNKATCKKQSPMTRLIVSSSVALDTS